MKQIKLKKFNIALIGDSISKGLYLDGLKPKALSTSAITIVESSLNVTINNISSFGQTLSRAYEKGILDDYYASLKGKNNICVFWIGGNDADYNWKEVAAAPTESHDPKTPLPKFESILDDITKKLCKKAKVIFITLPPIDSKRYFKNVISKLTDGDAVLKFFNGDITNINRHQECYNTIILKVAQAHSCPVIDIRTELLLDRSYLNLLADDGIHLSEDGQKKVAELVVSKIKPNININ